MKKYWGALLGFVALMLWWTSGEAVKFTIPRGDNALRDTVQVDTADFLEVAKSHTDTVRGDSVTVNRLTVMGHLVFSDGASANFGHLRVDTLSTDSLTLRTNAKMRALAGVHVVFADGSTANLASAVIDTLSTDSLTLRNNAKMRALSGAHVVFADGSTANLAKALIDTLSTDSLTFRVNAKVRALAGVHVVFADGSSANFSWAQIDSLNTDSLNVNKATFYGHVVFSDGGSVNLPWLKADTLNTDSLNIQHLTAYGHAVFSTGGSTVISRTRIDTLSIGKAGAAGAWTPKTSGAYGKLWYVDTTQDTFYLATAGDGSNPNTKHIILGRATSASANAHHAGDLIHIDGANRRLGLQVRNPHYELELGASDMLFAADHRQTSGVPVWTTYTQAGINENAWEVRLRIKTSNTGDSTLTAWNNYANNVTPNSGAAQAWFVKQASAASPKVMFWAIDNGTFNVNGWAHPDGLAAWDGATWANNQGDSTLTVRGGAHVKGGLKVDRSLNLVGAIDVNSGAIDGTPIGAASASTGAFTTLAASGNVSLTGNTLTVSATPAFSDGLTTNQLKVTGTSQLTGRVTASAGITSTISSTFSGGVTANSLNVSTATNWKLAGTAYTGSMANINVLVDNSMADALHRHSELSASDGTPDAALALDAQGGYAFTGPQASFSNGVTVGKTLTVKGRTVLGDASTDTVNITADSNFVTGGAVIGIAGGVRQRYVDSTVDSLRFTNGSVTFENGNVGIGTTAPRANFDVLSGTANTTGEVPQAALITAANQVSTSGLGNLFIQTNTAQAADVGGSIAFGGRFRAAGAEGAFFAGIAGRKENGTDANTSGYLGFYTRTSGGVTVGERMRITSTGTVLVTTTTAPTNAEMRINGELVLGDAATDNNHDLRINAGASYSEIDAGEAQFAISSLSDMKMGIKPLVDVTSLRNIFRDSTTVQTWKWKRETLYQQRIIDEIMADSLRVPDLVLEEVAKREKIQVDTDTVITAWVDTLVSISSRDSVIVLAVIGSLGEVVTSTKIATYYDTLQTIETHYDTTLTPILYTVTSPEKKTIADSIRTAVVGTATAKVVAYNAKIDAQAGRQHIGIMAEDAYRIAKIIAPEAAEPGVLDGNILQAALVQMAIAHERELDSLKIVIAALYKQVDAMQFNLDARLKILEAK